MHKYNGVIIKKLIEVHFKLIHYFFFYFFKHLDMYVHTYRYTHSLFFMHLTMLTKTTLKLLFWADLRNKQKHSRAALKLNVFYFTYITKGPNIFWSLEMPNRTDITQQRFHNAKIKLCFLLQQKQFKSLWKQKCKYFARICYVKQ